MSEISCSAIKFLCLDLFCDAEKVSSASGTNFIWLNTPAGTNATFSCAFSRNNDTVYRFCTFGGEWQPFDETGCGVVLGELNKFNSSFANVRQ